MLAEKFFLVLETLKSHADPDGSPRVASGLPFVPTAEREREVATDIASIVKGLQATPASARTNGKRTAHDA
jgi:hypothetical protein